MSRKSPASRSASRHIGFDAASHQAAEKAGVSEARGDAIIAAAGRKASAKAKRANPNLNRIKGA